MRRSMLCVFGLLEFAVAGLLVTLGSRFPVVAELDKTFANAERVTYHAGSQVRLFRQQVNTLRRPELQDLARRLQTQTRKVTATLKSGAIDYDAVRVLRDALGDVADGLDTFADTLDPDRVGQLGKGLGETAAFLNEKAVPTAKSVAKSGDEITASVRAVAVALRQAERGIQDAVRRWPEVRRALSRSAALLKSTRDQLDQTLEHRDEFEAELTQTINLAEAFATLLPLFTDHVGAQLEEQEQTLGELGDSIDEFGAALPAYAKSASSLLQTVRWLIWLVAGVVGLHGFYTVASASYPHERASRVERASRRASQPTSEPVA